MNDFEMVPVVPIKTGITSVFTFQTRCISNIKVLIIFNFLGFFNDHISVSLKLQRLLTIWRRIFFLNFSTPYI